MILTSPLVVEKVWLDKPKYDAAERRYYESLSKSSVPPKTEASHNCSANSDIVCPKSVSDKNIEEGDPIVVEDNEISHTPLSGNVNEKVEQVTDVCVKPTKVPEAIKPATPEAKKKKKDSKSPPQKVDETKLEKDSTTQIKKDTNVCSLPSKPEKQKKHGALSQKNDSDSNISIASTKNESDEIIRSKVQSNAKDLEGKLLQALQNNQKIDTNITEQITDVTKIDDIAVTSNTVSVEVTNRLVSLEKENQELTSRMEKMEQRIVALEKALQAATAAAAAVASRPVEKAAPKPQPPAPKPSNDDDDDGVDLFGSDSEEEDAEAAKIKEQRLAEYAARKAKKPVLIAKSNIILDVKPWDDETDMKLMEAEVRKIQCDGLVWGASKLVPLAYGIHKLQISCVVEDDKVSVDWLQESIEGIEDYVQSVDIAAFNKV